MCVINPGSYKARRLSKVLKNCLSSADAEGDRSLEYPIY